MNSRANNLVIIGAYVAFISMIFYCLSQYKDFSIVDKAISDFGINKSTKYPFSICIITLSLLLLYIQQSVKANRIAKKWLLASVRYGAVISSLSLIVVATIDLTNSVHNLFAFIYFIITPLLALGFGVIFRMQGDKTLSTYLFIISISNIIISFVVVKLFKGFFIAEVCHSQIIFIYVYLLNKQK